jgi:OOP family OmpA-OmpF porin
VGDADANAGAASGLADADTGAGSGMADASAARGVVDADTATGAADADRASALAGADAARGAAGADRERADSAASTPAGTSASGAQDGVGVADMDTSGSGKPIGGGQQTAALASESGGTDTTSGIAGTPSAGQTSASGEGGATLSGAPSAPPEKIVVGVVEAPGKKATSTEIVIPQTLGGMLPMTLGLEGDGEFDFDKAVLRQQVKAVLDELATKLRGAEYDRLEIIGHADRIGTEDYNQYLSERRAWAVARYLIGQGVPVTKLAVEGRGMHEPLTPPDACAGLSREEMIPCLQPDRRVVISASIRRADVSVH